MSLKKGSCKASSAVTRSFGSNSNMGIRKSENSFKRNGELGKSRITITIISSVPFFVTHKIYVPVRCQGPTRTFRWELHTVAMVSASICVAALLCEQFDLFDCHQIISSLIHGLPSILIIYPSAFIKRKASSIHMISKSDSSFSSFCSTSACWRLVYGAMQCNGNVPSQGNGATKADATNRCHLTKNKQTITTKPQVMPRSMLRADEQILKRSMLKKID